MIIHSRLNYQMMEDLAINVVYLLRRVSDGWAEDILALLLATLALTCCYSTYINRFD